MKVAKKNLPTFKGQLHCDFMFSTHNHGTISYAVKELQSYCLEFTASLAKESVDVYRLERATDYRSSVLELQL